MLAGAGWHIAHRPVADCETVLDVPAKLSGQVPVFATSAERKTDAVGAHSVALAALRSLNLVQSSLPGPGVAWAAARSGMFDITVAAEIWRIDHERSANDVAFSSDGSKVVTGTSDGSGGSVMVFDASTGAKLWRLDQEHGLTDVAFSPDSTRLAVGSASMQRGGSARMFDAATGAQLWRIDCDKDVRAMAFSPDGTWAAFGTSGGSLRVLDTATGAEV
jgi:outer membrane protein assembly factor BamB